MVAMAEAEAEGVAGELTFPLALGRVVAVVETLLLISLRVASSSAVKSRSIA